MEAWKGRVALITGASSGIGAELAKQLSQHGIKVIGCGRTVDKIQELKTENGGLENSSGTHIRAIKCDMRSEREILAMFEIIKEHYGGVDICINNAGLAFPEKLLCGDTEKWREMFEVNVLGLSICTREAIKSMKERGIDDGYVINIGSLAGHAIKKEWSNTYFYSGTKAMVKALTEGVRQELLEAGSNIRISMISPGTVISDFALRMYPDHKEAVLAYQQSKELLTVGDIADTVMYLLKAPARIKIHDVIFGPKDD
ncbi:dehydrogenase/reductase SDR family member 11-like [Glandiceps talaboti]